MGGALAGSLVGLPSPGGQRRSSVVETTVATIPWILMATLLFTPEWFFSTAQTISPTVGAYLDDPLRSISSAVASRCPGFDVDLQ